MRSGELKQSIYIQKQVETGRDSLNNPIVDWQPFNGNPQPVYASIQERYGTERFDEETNQRYTTTTYNFRVRYFEVVGIDESMRIISNNLVYQIKAILPDHQRREYVVIETFLQDSSPVVA